MRTLQDGPCLSGPSLCCRLKTCRGNPAQEYFADGMTDEMITMLAKNPALRVTSRTSVMQYKKVHRRLREIARELGVDGILEGSVGRSGNRVHITAQLIHAASDTHIWAESFDRDLSGLSSLQNELAETIAKRVGPRALVSRRRDNISIHRPTTPIIMAGITGSRANTKRAGDTFKKRLTSNRTTPPRGAVSPILTR